MSLKDDIKDVINRNSAENGSNTPDFILAEFLTGCLSAFDEAARARVEWYGERAGWETKDCETAKGAE